MLIVCPCHRCGGFVGQCRVTDPERATQQCGRQSGEWCALFRPNHLSPYSGCYYDEEGHLFYHSAGQLRVRRERLGAGGGGGGGGVRVWEYVCVRVCASVCLRASVCARWKWLNINVEWNVLVYLHAYTVKLGFIALSVLSTFVYPIVLHCAIRAHCGGVSRFINIALHKAASASCLHQNSGQHNDTETTIRTWDYGATDILALTAWWLASVKNALL